MKRSLTTLLFLWIALPATSEQAQFPWLSQLDPDQGVRESGALLVGLPYGLHALEQQDSAVTKLLIGVHGWRSSGYEWVYPLLTIDNKQTLTFFFNWDTEASQCQAEVAQELQAQISALQDANPTVESITVVGHSLGGVVVALLADSWEADVPLDIHTVATPLAMLSVEDREDCNQALPENQNTSVRFFQWRTQFELDNAFNRLDSNPMDVDIPNSVVVVLPETYRDRRLGHNWSLSYVAERIATQ